MIFTRTDWDKLATLFDGVCREGCDGCEPDAPCWMGPYAGYKPETREAPNGDMKACPDCEGFGGGYVPPPGRMICETCNGTGRVPNVDAEGVCGCCGGSGDRAVGLGENGLSLGACRACNGTGRTAGKRYLHIADKYDPPAWAKAYQDRAYAEACRVAEALRVPREFWPMPSVGALRVLEYPPGAGTAEHTDADLFTIVCWRETPEDLERDYWPSDAGPGEPSPRDLAEALSPGLHIGQIGELVGLGPATPHRVPARPYVQRSIVAFAMPRLDALLPTLVPLPDNGAIPRPMRNQTVREWIEAWKKRGRVYA